MTLVRVRVDLDQVVTSTALGSVSRHDLLWLGLVIRAGAVSHREVRTFVPRRMNQEVGALEGKLPVVLGEDRIRCWIRPSGQGLTGRGGFYGYSITGTSDGG